MAMTTETRTPGPFSGIELLGSGGVRYTGQPKLSTRIAGSGSVKQEKASA
jgi:hypothetical protein